jgi:hypothetical protein
MFISDEEEALLKRAYEDGKLWSYPETWVASVHLKGENRLATKWYDICENIINAARNYPMDTAEVCLKVRYRLEWKKGSEQARLDALEAAFTLPESLRGAGPGGCYGAFLLPGVEQLAPYGVAPLQEGESSAG